MAKDSTQQNTQDKSRTQQQSAHATTSAAGDRERGIQTQREGDRLRSSSSGLAPRRGSVPAYGTSSPFTLMQRMAEDMDRLFEQFGFGRSGLGLTPSLGSLLEREPWGGSTLPRSEESLWSPQVEVFQRGDKLVVRADLPGLKRDDLHVEVENDVLTISGERRDEHEEEREGFYRSERSYGRFHRAIPLPDGVNADQIDARYNDGVLEVTLPAPRQEQRKTKRIEIR